MPHKRTIYFHGFHLKKYWGRDSPNLWRFYKWDVYSHEKLLQKIYLMEHLHLMAPANWNARQKMFLWSKYNSIYNFQDSLQSAIDSPDSFYSSTA